MENGNPATVVPTGVYGIPVDAASEAYLVIPTDCFNPAVMTMIATAEAEKYEAEQPSGRDFSQIPTAEYVNGKIGRAHV